MKNRVNELLFGKNTKLSGLIAMAVIGSFVLGCNCGKNFDLANLGKESNSTTTSSPSSEPSSDIVPSNTVVEGLVKDTISQFSDAVDSGDFSDLHANASKDFQATYTVAQMTTAFKSYLNKKSTVVPIMNKAEAMSPVFKRPPSIRSEQNLNILMAEGEFKTKPFKVRYDFEYVMRGGSWKLLKLVINIP